MSPKEETARFVATTVHLDHITTALNCLTAFGTKEDVLIYIDRDGLSFVRENNRTIKIQLLLAKELFMSYTYEGDDDVDEENDHMKLCIKINHLLDSVNIMNNNNDDVVECTMSYDGNGAQFVLIFEDSLISERVSYSTYLVKEIDNTGLILDKNQLIMECIIRGDVLYSALKDLKEIDCKECYVYAKTYEDGGNLFALISKSNQGISKIKIPSSRSILEKLEVYEDDSTTLCHNTPVIGYFDFNTFDKIRMSTKIASKVLFRMDVHGLLSVNILSQTDDIIITDNRKNSKSNNDKGSRNSNKQQIELPNDYPGIVSEICLLEKERIDEEAQEDIEALMETDEFGGRKKRKVEVAIRRPKSSDVEEADNSQPGNSSNLLDLSTTDPEEKHKHIPHNDDSEDSNVSTNVSNINEDDEEKTNSSVNYGAQDLPLFF